MYKTMRWETAQLMKHKWPGLMPSTHGGKKKKKKRQNETPQKQNKTNKKLGEVAHTCKSQLWRSRERGIPGICLPSQEDGLRTAERP